MIGDKFQIIDRSRNHYLSGFQSLEQKLTPESYVALYSESNNVSLLKFPIYYKVLPEVM